MEKLSLKDAVRKWVLEFNQIDSGIIQTLMSCEPDDWEEVTMLTVGDRVYYFGDRTVPDGYGEIHKIEEDEYGDVIYYIIMDDGSNVTVDWSEITKEFEYTLPIWSTMWSFKDPCDIHWIEEMDGVSVLSKCGFRVYRSEKYGYFFGIDGAGYSFYDEHWTPLYKLRGLKWHKEDI